MLMMEVECESLSVPEFASSLSNDDSGDSDDLPLSSLQNVSKLTIIRKKRNSHQKQLKKGKIYECDVCKKRLFSKDRLRVHLQKHFPSVKEEKKADDKRWECKHCKRKFVSEAGLNRHTTTYPGPHQFTCNFCHLTFLKLDILLRHEKLKHSQENVTKAKDKAEFSCDECGKMFFSEEGKLYHEKTQHRERLDEENLGSLSSVTANVSKIVTCNICNLTVPTKSSLQSHLKTHNVTKNVALKPGNYQCIICPRSFSSSDGIKYHLATHTGERRYQCDSCKRRFIKKTHLAEHIATHSQLKVFTCERCPRKFSTYSAYKKHGKMFPGPHNFFCGKCGKVFMKESMLEKHLCVDLVAVTLDPKAIAQRLKDIEENASHPIQDGGTKNSFSCLKCLQVLNSAIEWQAHWQTHSDTDSPFTCYKCLKAFLNEEELQTHQKEHVGKQNYQCPFCSQSFSRSELFRSHILSHLGNSPYMCRLCNRKFNSPLTLASHLKKYPGEHNFTCTKCKRKFPSSEKLEKHDCILENSELFTCACQETFCDWNSFLTHIKKKPYKCCKCSREFLTIIPLTRHIKKHTGSKPFSCHCGKSFLTKLSHQNHLKVHKESVMFQCESCDYSTKYRKRLDLHKLKRHDIGSVGSLCPVCGMLISSMPMKQHLEISHGNSVVMENDPSDSQELCNLCGKMLNNKYSLRSHMTAIHGPSVEKSLEQHQCQVCGESFQRASLLERHIQKEEHDEPGPRPCPTCQFICKSRKELKRHEKKHDTRKPFSCPRCNKRFKVAASLKYHATICSKDARRRKEPTGEEVHLVTLYTDYEQSLMPLKWTY